MWFTEFGICVKVEVAVLGSPSLISLMVSMHVKEYEKRSFQISPPHSHQQTFFALLFLSSILHVRVVGTRSR